MMAKLVSIYVVSIVLPVLVLSATRNEHPLTVLHEIYTYVKTSACNGWGLAMRIMHKVPISHYMNTLLTRLGLSPQPSNHHTTTESTTTLIEEVESLPLPPSSLLPSSSTSVRDEYEDILNCTIGLLRQGEDLSLAYRDLSYIPTFFASNPEGTISYTYLLLLTFAHADCVHFFMFINQPPSHIHIFPHSSYMYIHT